MNAGHKFALLEPTVLHRALEIIKKNADAENAPLLRAIGRKIEIRRGQTEKLVQTRVDGF